MYPEKITIGTRGSKLALYQAHKVKSEIEKISSSIQIDVKIIKTKGDKILDVALSKIGDKGLFTKELEIALLQGEIDCAVHSLKDLPTELPAEFTIGAVLERADNRDAFVSKKGLKLKDLTANHVVATSSLRRIAGLKKINPNVKIVDIRGNVNTRLQKMEDGYCDAMIMATAGLKRLELDNYITEIIEPDLLIPAVAQGAIAVETRSDDQTINSFFHSLNHKETYLQISAERAFMKTLEGGCQVPVGAYSKISGNTIELTGFVASIDGKEYLKSSIKSNLEDAKNIGIRLAEELITKGAQNILEEIRNK